jgi:dTMP kinase
MIRFITFEGGDGTGKTTQIRSLEGYLRDRRCPCVVTREPGATALGKLLRDVLLKVGDTDIASSTELFLYLADRAQHVKEVVLPAMASGKLVLCDRFTDSTLAYQGYGRGLDLDWLRKLNEMAAAQITPDLTFLFDCPVEIGLARAAQRRDQSTIAPREDRFEREKLAFHERVRQGFLELASSHSHRFRIIDASGSVEHSSKQIRAIIDREVVQ